MWHLDLNDQLYISNSKSNMQLCLVVAYCVVSDVPIVKVLIGKLWMGDKIVIA